VTYDQNNIGGIGANNTLVLTPYVRHGDAVTDVALIPAAIAGGLQGPLDWGCASDSNEVAKGRELPAVVMGKLPARFAPSECR